MRLRSEIPTSIQYEIALRCIGQDLANLVLESLEITLEGAVFVVDGYRVAFKIAALSETDGSVFERAWQKMLSLGAAGDKVRRQSFREAFNQRYTPDDIVRLERIGVARRSAVPSAPKVSSLAEALRSVGRVLDAKEGQLVRIMKDRNKIVFEYKDVSGVAHREEQNRSLLYRIQQAGVFLRGKKKTKDTWEGMDR